MRNTHFSKIALNLLFGVILTSAYGQELAWESIEPDFFNNPDYSGSYGDLTGLDGYFYIWTAFSADPGYAVLRSQNGVSWQVIGPGSRSTEGIKLTDGRILLYGFTDTIILGQGETWEVRDASPDNSAQINSAVEGNSLIIMVGSMAVVRSTAPAIWVSDDGGSTFKLSQGAEPDFSFRNLEMTITFANGIFVAVGVPGEVWTSTDGEQWTKHLLPTATVNNTQQVISLKTVTYANGAFFAGGDYGTLFRSSDAVTWDLIEQGESPGLYNTIDAFIFDGDNAYAAGGSGDMFWSVDRGTNWNYYFRSGNASDLTGGNGRYYADGHIVPGGGPISPERDLNLEFWESFSSREIAFTDGKWLVIQSLSQNAHIGTPVNGNVGFLDSADTTDGVYYNHPWFGWFTLRSGDWVYHFNMGWIYSGSDSNANVWIFTNGLEWIYTSETLWPYFYHLVSGHWGLYAGGPDWFWNETLQAWKQREAFAEVPNP